MAAAATSAKQHKAMPYRTLTLTLDRLGFEDLVSQLVQDHEEMVRQIEFLHSEKEELRRLLKGRDAQLREHSEENTPKCSRLPSYNSGATARAMDSNSRREAQDSSPSHFNEGGTNVAGERLDEEPPESPKPVLNHEDTFTEGDVVDPDAAGEEDDHSPPLTPYTTDGARRTSVSFCENWPTAARRRAASRMLPNSQKPRMLEVWGPIDTVPVSNNKHLREESLEVKSHTFTVKNKLRRARTGDVRVSTQSRFQWLVMRPTSQPRVMWDIVSSIVVMYDLILIPMEAFRPKITPVTLALDWLTTGFWIADMGASCITGYYEDGMVEMSFPQVVKRYLQTWFTIDLFAVCADVVILVLGTGSINAANLVRFSKASRLIRVLRFLRLTRLKKLHKALTELLDKVQSEYFRILLSVSILLMSIVILNHYIACGWFAVGHGAWAEQVSWIRQHRDTSTWVFEHPHVDHDSTENILYWYSTSLHWSLTQFTPASMEVHATNTVERFYSVFVLLFALVAFSSFLSSITASMTNLRQLQQDAIQQEGVLRKYFVQNEISAELGNLILKYFTAQRQAKHRRRYRDSEVPLLAMLPEHLLTRIHEELYLPVIIHHPFLEHYTHLCPNGACEVCHRAILMRHVSKGEAVFLEGEQGEKMVFVVRGDMDYFRSLHLDTRSNSTLAHGHWAAEHVLWMYWVHCGRLVGKDNGECVEVVAEAFRKVVLSDYHAIARDHTAKYARLFSERILDLELDQLSDIWHNSFALEALVQRTRESSTLSLGMGEGHRSNSLTGGMSRHAVHSQISGTQSSTMKHLRAWVQRGGGY